MQSPSAHTWRSQFQGVLLSFILIAAGPTFVFAQTTDGEAPVDAPLDQTSIPVFNSPPSDILPATETPTLTEQEATTTEPVTAETPPPENSNASSTPPEHHRWWDFFLGYTGNTADASSTPSDFFTFVQNFFHSASTTPSDIDTSTPGFLDRLKQFMLGQHDELFPQVATSTPGILNPEVGQEGPPEFNQLVGTVTAYNGQSLSLERKSKGTHTPGDALPSTVLISITENTKKETVSVGAHVIVATVLEADGTLTARSIKTIDRNVHARKAPRVHTHTPGASVTTTKSINHGTH